MIPQFIFTRRNFGGLVSKRGVENVRALHIEHICETSNHHVLGSSKIDRIKFCLIVSSDFFSFLFSLFYPNQHFVVVCSTYICRVFFFFFFSPLSFSCASPGRVSNDDRIRGCVWGLGFGV